MRCKFINGKRTPLIGAHTPPSLPLPSTLEDLVETLAHLRDQHPVVLGNLNTGIQAHNSLSQRVAELLMEFRLVDF